MFDVCDISAKIVQSLSTLLDKLRVQVTLLIYFYYMKYWHLQSFCYLLFFLNFRLKLQMIYIKD